MHPDGKASKALILFVLGAMVLIIALGRWGGDQQAISGAISALIAALVLLSVGDGQRLRQEKLIGKAQSHWRAQSPGAHGRYDVAVAQIALRVLEAISGPEQVNVAKRLISLALIYCAQGKYAQAEPLLKRSLAIREKALGPDHPDVAESLSYLKWLYRDQGKYAEAEPLYKRALEIREKVLGPNHPKIVISLGSLAWLYHAQGKYAEAEPLYKRALAIWDRALGPDDADVAWILESYAVLLRDTNRKAEAEKLECRAKVIRGQHTQEDRPN